jgi:hypothetical protein
MTCTAAARKFCTDTKQIDSLWFVRMNMPKAPAGLPHVTAAAIRQRVEEACITERRRASQKHAHDNSACNRK